MLVVTLVDRRENRTVPCKHCDSGTIYPTLPQGAPLAIVVPLSALGRRTTLHRPQSRRTTPDSICIGYASSRCTYPECMYSWTSTLGERMLEIWLKLKSVMQSGNNSTKFKATRLQPDMVGLVPIIRFQFSFQWK
jgi:hypothetical protein